MKLKDIVNAALEAPADADRAEGGGGADVRTVFTYRRDATFSASGAVPDDYEEKSPMTAGRDVYMDELLLKVILSLSLIDLEEAIALYWCCYISCGVVY